MHAAPPLQLPQLALLDISDNPLGEAGGRHLAAVVGSSAAHLQTLSLSRTAVGDGGAAALGAMLAMHACTALTQLDLSGCGITVEGVRALATGAGTTATGLPALQHLCISGNALGEVCFALTQPAFDHILGLRKPKCRKAASLS